MDTVVLKFGGSSLADNSKLNIVADKIIEFEKNNRVVVVVSAQGKTTDRLISEAHELAQVPDERELDVLLSTGEQISTAKLAILLKEKGKKSISLTGWQAGIVTSNENQNAKIETINTERINKELDSGNIVIIAGFQGINSNEDITTLGRGGSDTSAVAIAASIKAKNCYIFSDVDGVYSTDPKKIQKAEKIKELSYVEMLDISHEGAKVLHNRCVEIGQKYNLPIIAESTFNNKIGSKIQNKIEDTNVKSIIKNDDITYITVNGKRKEIKDFNILIQKLLLESISINNIENKSNVNDFIISFTIKNCDLNKTKQILDRQFKECTYNIKGISRIGIVGFGIMNDKNTLEKILKIIENNKLELLHYEITETKIAIMFKEKIDNKILEELHLELIEEKLDDKKLKVI